MTRLSNLSASERRSLRILHVITMDRIRSGGPTQLKRLAVEQAARGHRVTVVFGHNPEHQADFQELKERGVRTVFLAFDGFRASPSTVRSIFALRRLVLAGEYDVIHAHKGDALYALIFATLGVPTPMVANRGMSARLSRRSAIKWRSRRVRRIIAVSQNVKEVLIRTAGLPPGKIEVVYGSIDPEKFHPGVVSSLRDELAIGAGRRVIGYLGSLGGRKGVPQLIEAFARLRAQRDDVVLVMVGVTEGEMAHRKVVIPECLRPYVHLVPFRRDVPNCLAAFDLFVFPGTRNEGLTGTVREAAAMALPVVTTDVGGNAELIRSGNSGLVVPPDDAGALSTAMQTLLSDRQLAQSCGLAAREAVLASMTDRHRTDRLDQIYEQVIEECLPPNQYAHRGRGHDRSVSQ